MFIVCPPHNKNAQFGSFVRAAGGAPTPFFSIGVTGLVDGVARIGVELTAAASSFSEGAPASISWQWVNATGPGANAATYTPVAGDDLAIIYTSAPSVRRASTNSAQAQHHKFIYISLLLIASPRGFSQGCA